MFYDRFEELCARKGVKVGRACAEMGVSRSLAAKWKATGTERPSAEVLEKMSEYFDMSIDAILGVEKDAKADGKRITDEELKFALFGDTTEITDADLEDVRRYAEFVRQQKARRKQEK